MTRGEIAAFRRLQELESAKANGRRFLIGTTSLLNFETFFGELESAELTLRAKKVKLAKDLPQRGAGPGTPDRRPAGGGGGWFGGLM